MFKYGLYLVQGTGNPFDEVISTEGYLILPGSRVIAIWIEFEDMREVFPVEGETTIERLDEYLKLGIKRIRERVRLIKELEENYDGKKCQHQKN